MAKNILELIKTWHGSPHDFDAFDFSHMGKGEGAQVYGKGGYSTESRDVAQQYKDVLSPKTLTISGEDVAYGNLPDALGFRGIKDQYGDDITSDTAYMLRDAFMSHGGNVDNAIADLESVAIQNEKFFYPSDHLRSAINILDNNRDKLGFESIGKLYELGLDVDPQKMLDWREPLSIQPKILDLIGDDAELIANKINNRRSARSERVIGDADQYAKVDPLKLTGKEVYRGVGELYQDRIHAAKVLISNRFDELNKIVTSDDEFIADMTGKPLSDIQKRAIAEKKKLSEEMRVLNQAFMDPYAAASNKLRDKGVQGIQYLGEFNRTQGEGARNYVNFNADEMKILNKYLRPETAVIAGAGAVAGLAPNDSFAGVGTPDYALPMAAQAAGQSDLSGKANPGREVGTVLAGLDMLLPLVGEAFKPATMGNAELTDEIRKRGYYGMQ